MTSGNVYHQVTHERIAELFSAGVTYANIARRLGCSVDTIFFRLRQARRADPETARQDQEQRTCKCGRRKRPSFSECCWCRGRKSLSQPKHDCNDEGQLLLRLVEEKPEATDQPKTAEQSECETNTECPCGRLDGHGNPRITSGPNRCILCEGTSEKLDQLMAAERGVSVEELRRLLAEDLREDLEMEVAA